MWLAVLALTVSGMSLPHDKLNEIQVDQPELDEKERATWLDTRELEDEFKELVMMALGELESEGRLPKGITENQTKEKRGRWQGFCFRKTRSGRFLPYICWKGGKK